MDVPEEELDEIEAEGSFLPAIPDVPLEEMEDSPYQQAARGRIVAFPFAMGFIGLGILLLAESQIEGFDVTVPIAGLIMTAALVLTNLFRFFASGRRERGLFFLALTLLMLGGMLALMSVAGDQFNAETSWPLIIIGLAGVLVLTNLVDIHHESGLIRLAALFLLAGAVAFIVTQGKIPQDRIDQVADYWPLIIAFLGITLIPLAMRHPTE